MASTVWSVDVSNPEAESIEFVATALFHCWENFKRTRSFELVNLSIGGYDEDPRALFSVPEVGAFCRSVYGKFPWIFLCLEPRSINWFFLCLADVEILRVDESIPDGLLGDYYRDIGAEARKKLRRARPSSFHRAQIKIQHSGSALLAQIRQNATDMLQTVSRSDAELAHLAEEFESRLRAGIPCYEDFS